MDDLSAYNSHRTAAGDRMRRRKMIGRTAAAAASLAILFAAWTTAPAVNDPADLMHYVFYIVICVALFVAANMYAKAPGKALRQDLHGRIVPPLFHFADDLRSGGAAAQEISRRLPRTAAAPHNRRGFDGIASGRLDGVPFEICDAKLYHESRKRDHGDTHAVSTTFEGVLLGFALETPFPGTIIAARPPEGAMPALNDITGFRTFAKVPVGGAGYEVRSDDPEAARPLITADFTAALDLLREGWPDRAARIVIHERDGFVMLPQEGVFLDLPDVSVAIDYRRHIEPLARRLATLLTAAQLVRQALTH